VSTETSTSGGGGFFLLFLVFLVLKLTDVIDWSWWWVTAPLWVPVAFTLVAVLIAAPFVAGIALYDRAQTKKRLKK
jgi:phosphoglycerol transferase MdoB-like AlkP superfamily enzyme